ASGGPSAPDGRAVRGDAPSDLHGAPRDAARNGAAERPRRLARVPGHRGRRHRLEDPDRGAADDQDVPRAVRQLPEAHAPDRPGPSAPPAALTSLPLRPPPGEDLEPVRE